MIAIGGGKDSCVSLELLKEEKDRSAFIINPKPAVCSSLSEPHFTRIFGGRQHL